MTEKQLTEEEIIIGELETLINSLKGDWRILNGKIEKKYLDKKFGKIGRIKYCIDLEIIRKIERMTEKERSCGHCKYLQIDGMFGMWCDKGRDWGNTDAEYCPDYER